ncbi:AHH domain-containing protein [Myxococcota bacterium]|nr:AHH domain-containing protein [Myxococcota bacterium]
MTERMVIGPGKALKSIIVGTAKTALKAGGHIGHRIRHGSWHPDAKRDIVSFGIDLVMTYAGGKVLQRLAKTRLGTWISKNSSIQIPNSGTTQRLNSGIRSAIKTAGGVAVTKPSSRALSQALEAGGHVRPAASAAHHIVAGGAEAAAPARAVLKRFGIGINNAANGVFLPASRAAPNAEGAAVHSTLHTRPYYQAVNDALGQATTRGEALEALGALRQGLLGGGL